MIKSMTGYGRAVETVNGREFTVELRSVNNRYLDCSVKMPRSVSFAEEAVKQAVKQSVSRGKVDVFISVKSENSDDTKITLNTSVLEGYLGAMRQMVEEFEAWCFDETREAGHTGLVRTTYGYHVMYFVNRRPIWVDYVKQDMISEKSLEMMEQLILDYPMEVDYSAITLGFVDLGQ